MAISATFNPRRILLIKLRHHGDVLLTTPVINALREHYPDAAIDMLMYKETCPMLEAHPALRRLLFIDRKWKKEGWLKHLGYEWRLLKAIRQCHYDLVINLADQWRSALLAAASTAPVRTGFDYHKRQHFIWRLAHNERVSTKNFHHLHTIEQNLLSLAPLGINNSRARASMHYHQRDWLHTRQRLDTHGVSKPYIVIQPTSRWIFKCWDDEKVAELINALSSQDYQLVLTAAPDKGELAMIDSIQALAGNPNIISLAGQLSLPQLASLLDHARLFIGVDSAPMHMAAALNTPCIALFGPTKLTHWRPWGENNQVIWAGNYGDLPSPDSINTHTEKRYLSAIPVEVVTAAARSYLDA